MWWSCASWAPTGRRGWTQEAGSRGREERRGAEMIVNMFADATPEQIGHVVDRIKECGFQAHLIRGEERTVIGIVGNSNKHRPELEALRASPGVEELVPISHPFKLASRSCRPEGS